jgi:hypothetical protein
VIDELLLAGTCTMVAMTDLCHVLLDVCFATG